MKTTEDLFKASEEIGQGDKSEIQGGRGMRLTEAVEILNKVGAYVNVALRELQEKRIQQALDTGYRHIYGDVPLYKEAISLLIECGRTDLLKTGYHKKTYESVCKAYPLLKQVMYDSLHSGKRIGEAEAKGNVWAVDIKAYWDSVVLPLLQTNSQAQAETTPQKQGNKPQQVPSWATTEEAKRAFAKAVELDYMIPLEYGYKWKLNKGLLAYFVERLSNATMLNPYPNEGACAYFHTKDLKQTRQYYLEIEGGRPKNFDKIDALFE